MTCGQKGVISKTPVLFMVLLVISLFTGCTVAAQSGQTLRFENFKDEKDFLSFFEKNYPSGTPEKHLIEALSKAGAKCSAKEKNQLTPKRLEGLPPNVQVQLKKLYEDEPHKIACTYNQTLAANAIYKRWMIEILFSVGGEYRRTTARIVVNAL